MKICKASLSCLLVQQTAIIELCGKAKQHIFSDLQTKVNKKNFLTPTIFLNGAIFYIYPIELIIF